MKIIAIACCVMMSIAGCASRDQAKIVYYDIEGINRIPGGVSAVLSRPGDPEVRDLIKIIGNFGESSIEIASRTKLDSPLVVAWRGKSRIDYERPFPFHILPPLDTANQKYHLRFTFFPDDSVKIQARAVAKTDCRHTIGHGSTAEAAFGPCISDDGWSNTVDSIHKGLIHRPWKGPMDIPGWD